MALGRPQSRTLAILALAFALLWAAGPQSARAGEGRRMAEQTAKRRGKPGQRIRRGRVEVRRGRNLRRFRRVRLLRRWRRSSKNKGSGTEIKGSEISKTRRRADQRRRRGDRHRTAQKIERLPPPPYPEGFSGPGDFARKVLRFGSGDDAARERIKSVDAKELRESGFTTEMARTWLRFLQNEKRRNPNNPSVRGRIELMEHVLDLYGDRDAHEPTRTHSARVRRIWRVGGQHEQSHAP